MTGAGQFVTLTLFWPESFAAAMREQSARLGRSPGGIVEDAWRLAAGALAAEDDTQTMDEGRPQPHVVELDATVFGAIQARAEQERCSFSWIIQRTLQVAWPKVVALPPRP
ncbi:MAG: hypothetical protein IPG50_01690 [Myxococcales bacterium]|nr:hypothetical protein [Myxococcales bacterium]